MKSKIKSIISKAWYWYNATFGDRTYFEKDGVDYVQEGRNKPEPLEDHQKKHHQNEDTI